MYIDTHTHIYLKDFDEDRKGIISECLDSGVNKLILPNIDKISIADVIKICEAYKNICYPMVGLHPCYIKESYEDDLEYLKPIIKSINTIAIGEIGIDLYWDKGTLEIQKKAFRQQLKWAKEYDLPVAIHIRKSFDTIFDVLEEVNDQNLRGVFHCFTGSKEQGQKAIEMGFMLGIGGVVTFKNSGLDKVLKELPLEKLLLETDSPYLAPTPYRGQRNESSFITIVAQKLAEIYEVNLEEVAIKTTHNAKTLFNL